MNISTSPTPFEHARPRWAARPWHTVLAASTVLCLGVGTSVAFAASDATRTHTPKKTASEALVTDYQPSQPTGWEPPYTPALGGHVPSRTLTYHRTSYRMALLGFGSSEKLPNPMYEPAPSDPQVAFTRTLTDEWGRYYTFEYHPGLPSGATFTVESYGVRIGRHAITSGAHATVSGLTYGGDIYFVYHPGSSLPQPAINSDLQFIQVLYNSVGTGSSTFVDSMRHNPFYGEGGGLTSIDGNQTVNFDDFIHQTTGARSVPRTEYRAETFLTQDTGTKNTAGKDIVNVYGGIKWGFELEPLSTQHKTVH